MTIWHHGQMIQHSTTRNQRFFSTAILAASTCLIAGSTLAQDPTYLPESMAIMPNALELKGNTPKDVQIAYYDLIWKSFIALNWPTDKGGDRGQPDIKAHILDQKGAGPLEVSVWETYREPGEVFISPKRWANYPEWNTPRPQPPVGRSLKRYSSGFTEYATEINQPYFFDQATGPLIDQNGNFVRYEVAINQAFFTYIKQFRYFDANRQIADVAITVANPPPPGVSPVAPRAGFQRPPHGNESYLDALPLYARQGLVDVKAAWRVLDPDLGDLPERYLHREIVIDDDGTTRTLGLVALHILRFLVIDGKPGYVAATFEQVDNVETVAGSGIRPSFNPGTTASAEQDTYGFEYSIPPLARQANPKPRAPVSIYRAKAQALPQAVITINQTYQDLLEGSVFQYYQLIGTQNKHPGKTLDFTDPEERRTNGHEGPITGVYTNTNNLVNSALESYTQENFTCILCHVRARPQGVPEKAFEDDYFKTLTFLLQMAQSRSGN